MGQSSSDTEYADSDYQHSSDGERHQRGGDSWFYVLGDAKKGPISALQIKELLNRGEIDTETDVWREGMREWQPLRESALGGLVAKEPPPVSNKLVRNGLVWTVAMLPLLYACIDAGIAQENQAAAARTIVLGMPFERTGHMPWVIPGTINAALCLWDNWRLKKAGYQNKWMLATAFALAPVYLFIRARVLKQKPTYAIAWLVTSIVGLLISSS
jgi:hypothetical protein